MPAIRIVQALIVCGATSLLLWAIVLRENEAPSQSLGLELVPFQPGGPAGTAFLERRGDRLAGTIVVWGLQPGTRHFVALRGPGPRCPAQITAAPALLASDENGVAFGRVDGPVPAGAFGEGLALTVHARADGGSPAVACGAAPSGRKLSPAELTQLGGRETGEPGASVSALLQLRDGRPIGRRAPLEIRARRGERVALALRADAPDELRLEGYGLAVQVGPGTIARLAFRADRPGRFAIAGRTTGRRPAAVLIVE